MNVANLYLGKSIAILNCDNVIGKMLLRKLIMLAGEKVKKIIIFDTHSRKKQLTSAKLYDLLIEQNMYFRGIATEAVKNKVQFISVPQQRQEWVKQEGLQEVDILYNCHIPKDFTRNNIENCLNSHIWKSKQICEFIRTYFKVQKIILISSLYSQNYGYVSQSEAQINALPLGYAPKDLVNPTKLKQSLMDIFTGDYEIWQWSVLYMQNIFALESGSKKTEVIRVPLIGPTLQNFEGYVLGFNTLTSLIYEIGKKQLNALQGNSNDIIDMIPGDFVAHYMLTVGVVSLVQTQTIIYDNSQQLKAKSLKIDSSNIPNNEKIPKSLKIIVHNLSTSSRNPISVSKFAKYIAQAWIQYSQQYYKAINFKIQQKKWQRKAYAIQQKLPNNVKSRLAHLFEIKSWKIEAQQQSISKNKKFQIMRKYRYFLEHEWICQSNKSIDYFSLLSNEDQIKLNFNVNSINWKTYAKLCCYSINKYLLGLQVQQFNPTSMDLLNLQKSTYFNDIVWALTQGKSITVPSPTEVKNYILSTKSVKEAISQLVEEQTKKLQQTPKSYEKVQEEFYKIADQMCTQMFSQYSMNSIRGFAWFLHKLFRTIYEKVVVDKKAIMKLKTRDERTHGPLILIPTHRSYVDFLILSYVFFGYGIKVPHIAAAEDFLNMAVVHILLRKSGAFFIKRDQNKYKNLYKAIMTEYISKLLIENHYLQFFIQGTRSRVGKMLQPKYGILSIICKNVLDGKIPDAQILPVTINFEKILEGTSYTYEMMGQSKVKQSLSRLIKAVDVIKQNYGRIYIELCEPISVKQYFAKNMPKFAEINEKNAYELTLNELGYKIIYDLTDALVITPPAIVASIILMDRIGISDDKLSEKARWLCQQLSSRGVKVARTQSDSSISVSNTLALMGEIINKSKKDMFEVQVSFDQNSFIQLFTLTYYRNTLTHIFFEEALIAVAMASFGYQDMVNCKIPLDQLKNSVIFLAKLLKKQYVLQNYISDKAQRFNEVLDDLVSKDVVQLRGEKNGNNETKTVAGIKNPQTNIFVFYCSLVWPVVESYWISVLYLFKLIKDKSSIPLPKLQSETQWFGQSLFTQRIILHLEAISMDTIKNATNTLKSMKILGEGKQAGKNGVKVIAQQTHLKLLQKKIQQYLKSKYASSIKGTIGGRGSVTLDFPFLSKL